MNSRRRVLADSPTHRDKGKLVICAVVFGAMASPGRLFAQSVGALGRVPEPDQLSRNIADCLQAALANRTCPHPAEADIAALRG
jgi:hypothetical protein